MHVVTGETSCAAQVKTDLEELPVPDAVVTQRSVIVIQDCDRLSVLLRVIKGKSLI